jgi:soluble lytic murein transglycosylase-like protein
MGNVNLAMAFALNALIIFFASIAIISCNKVEQTDTAIDFGNRKIILPVANKKQTTAITPKEEIPQSNEPAALQMFNAIEKYATEFDIPKHIMFNIAFKESRYMGPLHIEYMGNLGSTAGALGPMQIMVGTANSMRKTKVSPHKLKNDIDFNVQTSAMLLRYLFDKYNDWKLVCGAYNTGRPLVNAYAIFCEGNKDYQSNWQQP